MRKTFTSAAGNTTVPISRPSATTSAPSPTLRCRATMTSRTAGVADTGETASSTSGVRISEVTSRPLANTLCPDSDETNRISISRATFATRSWSSGSTPARRHSAATERYIAPVSRNVSEHLLAIALATEDLPEPEGPSIATIIQDPFRRAPDKAPDSRYARGTNEAQEPFSLLLHRASIDSTSVGFSKRQDPSATLLSLSGPKASR